MKAYNYLPMTLIAAAVLSSCGALPTSNSLLEQARSDYNNAQVSPQVSSLAPVELKQAGDSLDKANTAWINQEDRVRVDHLAYVAKQQVAIAQETASQKAAELAVASSSTERDSIRLNARTREADAAQRNAALSQRQSEASQRDALAAQRQSDASQQQAIAERQSANEAQRNAEASQQQAAAERLAANSAQLNAQVAREQTLEAENRNRLLEAQLKELEAKQTERGMVITLGDVLFDTNKAQLKSGGTRNVQKLADFFKQYPQRMVMIEGFTDSTGSDSINQALSEQRASSVRGALLDMGINSNRITARGYGSAYPVAGNENAAGRQLNRRVEIIVSDDSGKIASR